MFRVWLGIMAVVAAVGLSSTGCRSCSTCHDYDPPVANCDCQACGCNRAGSAYCNCASGQPADGYVEEEYTTEPAVPEGTNTDAAEDGAQER
jgi:hypothetical protein